MTKLFLQKTYASQRAIHFTLFCFGFLASCPSASIFATDNIAIVKLKEVEAKVSSVVAQNMKTCVAVSDGVGFGSGVIVSADGLVLTAGHVMVESDRGQYEVIMPSGRRVKAKALGKNLNTDTGMLQLQEPGPWPFVEINRSEKLPLGDWVVSLGHSGGWELGRRAPVRTGRILSQPNHQIMTDAVLIGGDSGGPLFNLDGELIGIHSSIGDSVAENRHVSMPSFFRDWERLKQGDSWGQLAELNGPDQKTKRGRIGVRVDKTNPRCLIKSVEPDSSAYNVGIEQGDIVTSFDNIAIINGQHLIDVIKRKYAGDVCPLTVDRNGKTIAFEILLR